MKKLVLILFILSACEQHEPVDRALEQVEPQSPTSLSVVVPIDRTIKRIPLGDKRLIGDLASAWSTEVENDLLSQLIIANEEIALLPLTQMKVPNLVVRNDFIPEYATGLKFAYDEYDEYETVDNIYTVLKTIWRTDDLHIVLAATDGLENSTKRTDLLVLKDDEIIDGVTVYYSYSEFSWGAYQLFYIDENKQIWLQRFVNDEESVQTMESLSLAVLPNGKIRAFKGLAGE